MNWCCFEWLSCKASTTTITEEFSVEMRWEKKLLRTATGSQNDKVKPPPLREPEEPVYYNHVTKPGVVPTDKRTPQQFWTNRARHQVWQWNPQAAAHLSFHPRSSPCCTGCWWCRACGCWTPATCTTRWCWSPPAVWPQPSSAGPRLDSPQWRRHLSWTSGLRSGGFLPGGNMFGFKLRGEKHHLTTHFKQHCAEYMIDGSMDRSIMHSVDPKFGNYYVAALKKDKKNELLLKRLQ